MRTKASLLNEINDHIKMYQENIKNLRIELFERIKNNKLPITWEQQWDHEFISYQAIRQSIKEKIWNKIDYFKKQIKIYQAKKIKIKALKFKK